MKDLLIYRHFNKWLFLIILTVSINSIFPQTQSQQWVIPDYEFRNNYVLSLAIDNQGVIWIGSEFSCVTKIENDSWTTYDLFCGEIMSLDVDDNDNLWIGSDGCQLTKFDGTNFIVYSPNQDSNFVNARHITVDNDNNVWFTSYDGVYKYSDSTWIHYNENNSSLPTNFVTSLTHNSNNNIWARSWKNLVFYNGSEWQSFSEYYPVPWNQSIVVDSNDIVWFGTDLGNLISFDMSSWNVIPPPVVIRYLGAIAIDDESNKWCGFDGGFAKYDGISWELYTTSNSPLPNDWVTSIVIDKYGNKWLGTYGGGMAIFNENGVVTSVNANSSENSTEFYLAQNFPNPFNPSTTIEFNIQSSSYVNLSIYDLNGQLIEVLLSDEIRSGSYKIKWDGSKYSSGYYFYKLTSKNFSFTKKCLLLK